MSALVTVVVMTLLVSGMCSLFEATLYSTRVAALEAAREHGRFAASAARFLRLKREIAVPTSAILILNTVANTAGATIAGMLAAEMLGPDLIPGFSAFLTVSILFLSEILPKTYGATHWRGLWPLIVWPLLGMAKILWPLIRITQWFSELFTRRHTYDATTEDEIVAMIRLGANAGELNRTEYQLLTSVFRFDELQVREVMTPRVDVVYLDVSWSLERWIDVIRTTHHTRYPLCKGSLDQLIGFVHIKDLVGLNSNEPFDHDAVTRPLRRVPETMRLRRLLRDMQGAQPHLAAVLDEHGTTVGVITLENVLEQIVGEVQDEFDHEEAEITSEGDGIYLVSGHIPVVRLNTELDLALHDPDADTLSGLLVARLGRLLEPGDVVEVDRLRAEVLEVRGHRASRVRLIVKQPSPPRPGSQSDPDES
ncbi:MAG: hemolysin family protein [Proteobacteria bacterium]|nr:hemolysin family protein [Pseudomonadota bacterium]